MSPENAQLAKALEFRLADFKSQGKSTEEFLKAIPNTVNYCEDPTTAGIEEIQLVMGLSSIKRVSTNGTHILIEDLV